MSYLPLARKYRPRSFDDVVGQHAVMVGLQHALTQQKLASAYLLTGTRGIGKTTLARLMATAVNCEKGITFYPCLCCDICSSTMEGINPDVYEVDGASKTKVEDVRGLLENTQYMPLSSRYKVYIIDEVHMLSHHAFNALLKTLEEPSAHILFILATTELEKIPITIRSRCLHYALLPFTDRQIYDRCAYILQQENIMYDESLMRVAQAGKGSLRDALTLLEQIIHIGQGTACADSVDQLLHTIPQHLFDTWIISLLSGDIPSLHATLTHIKTTQPPCKDMLEKLLTHWFIEAQKTLGHPQSTKFLALYDVTLVGIDQLSCVPDTHLHLCMVWLKLFHTLHVHDPLIVHVHHTPPPSAKIIDTIIPPADDTKNIDNHNDYITWLATHPNAGGLLKESLKHLTFIHTSDGVYQFHYPEQQEVLFQSAAQKKIIHFLCEHLPAKNIVLSPSSDTPTPVQQPLPDITSQEIELIRALGYKE